jgi:hypothetical protein
MGFRALVAAAFLMIPVLAGACDDEPTGADLQEAVLLSVVPQGDATGVDPNAPIVIEFSHGMMEGMEGFADVHEGQVEGPLVPGSWSWNGTRTQLTFTPDSALKPQTQYVIHIGGGMQDQNGQHINFQQHGAGMGGQWMTQQMHQGGQHGYGMGQGGMGMGEGWVHPGNGGFGMLFTFTTS